MAHPTVRIEFMGDYLTADDEEVWLDVAYIAEYPRDADGLCAYCHGDPCAERSAPDALISRNYAAWRAADWADHSSGFTCPLCEGRPT